ncbi:hypothetical protein ACFFP0_00705 [Rhizobium puerariae]|uniref:Uncharacterized protein n=1 Tax=Rhizobium puerariae TaxID=1585791 RepID=A0ABV6A9P7_9HYPH
MKGRCLGIDLNPNWIGSSVVENATDPAKLSVTKLLEHELVKLDMPAAASAELVRETLAAVCDRAVVSAGSGVSARSPSRRDWASCGAAAAAARRTAC